MRVFSNRLVQVLLLLLALGIAVLVSTPLLIKHYAVQWLQENGGDRVHFEDVDLNPFTGKLVLEGLDVQVDDDTTLSFATAAVDVAWLPLWHRQVNIQAVELSELTITIHQLPDRTLIGGIHLPGDDTPPAEQEPAAEHPWTAGIDTLSLDNIRVHYIDEKLDITLFLEQLQLDKLAQWSEQTPTPVSASGSINDAPFTLSGEITPFSATPRYDISLKLDALQLAAFEKLAQAQLDRLAGEFSYDGKLVYEQQPDGFKVGQDGTLRLQAYSVSVKQPVIAVSGDDSRVKSNLTLVTGGDKQDVQLKSDIALAGLDVSADEGRLRLLHSAGLTLSALELAGVDRISLDSVEAEDLSFARRTENSARESAADIDRLHIDKLALADNLLAIDSIKITGAHRDLHRDKEGNLAINGIIDDIKSVTAGEPATEPAAENEAPDSENSADNGADALAIAIGRIEVDGDSAFGLHDESVDPPLNTQIKVKTLTLAALDSRKPEQKSALNFEAGIGDHAAIDLEGDVQPFLEPPGVAVKSTISAMDLPPLSPYAEQALGLALDSGTLDADIKVDSGKDKLDGMVKLTLYHLQLKNVESENSLQSSLPVPINVALDSLRDGNDTIALKIPIKGDPANPAFNINDALTKALADGVQKGALTYLTLALQPYGAMITAAKYAGEAIAKVRLNPVVFPAGTSELDDTAKDYLSKVAKVLAERPKLAVKVCGVAVAPDRAQLQQAATAQQAGPKAAKTGDKSKEKDQPPAVPEISDEQLRALANARAGTVRDYLVQNFKTPASHLVSCQPRLESGESEDAAPRTDLLL